MYKPRDYVMGIQHLLAMFGSTVLVPLITGMSTSVALFTAGIGTLVFHLCTKGIVPVFLGSSFAFIPALCTVIDNNPDKIPLAQSGIIAAGIVYLLFALIAKLVGPDTLRKIIPPVVTGPVIIVIGLSLTGVGISDAMGGSKNLDVQTVKCMCIALFTFCIVIFGMTSKLKYYKMIPILIGMLCGYALCTILDCFGIYQMNYSPIANAPWINIPYQNGFLTLPQIDWQAVALIAPIAIVTFMEHIGDITTNGAVVGKDFFANPGLHRTLMGDGLATAVAGFFGGPSNTTYSENTGVLATTGNYNPALLRLAAYFAILLGLVGKFGAVLQTIPGPVKGGIEMILFGMIASVGIRTICEANIDLKSSRNLTIMGAVLCVGIGFGNDGISVMIGTIPVKISALFIATVIGIVLNLILPRWMMKLDIKKGDTGNTEEK